MDTDSPALPRFLRASLVGVLASALDLAVLTGLTHGLHWQPAQANLPGLAAGAAVQFLGARWFVFRAQGPWLRQARDFAGAELGTLALNAVLFQLLSAWTPLPVVAARLAATFAVFIGFSLPAWAAVFRRAAEPVR